MLLYSYFYHLKYSCTFFHMQGNYKATLCVKAEIK